MPSMYGLVSAAAIVVVVWNILSLHWNIAGHTQEIDDLHKQVEKLQRELKRERDERQEFERSVRD
jgi:DNA-binding ferritin-like protein